MSYHNKFDVGDFHSRKTILDIIEEPTLSSNREGIFYCKNSLTIILFTDLDKTHKKEQFIYNDYFENDYFHWDSQNKQHINTPRIKEIVNKDVEVILFCRIKNSIKGKTQPYIYFGRLEFFEYEKATKNPVHIIFNNIDHDDDLLLKNKYYKNIIEWKSENKTTQIDLSEEVSPKRKNNQTKPSKTERKGLVTTRVGQGWYRTEILKKWDWKCSVTGCEIQKILISSHIVPWRDSNDEERLDVDNGLLLSPDLDGLFDKNLISFNDDGSMMISEKLTTEELEVLGINKDMKLRFVNKGMKKYLQRHRDELSD
jgi:hypothetical protein